MSETTASQVGEPADGQVSDDDVRRMLDEYRDKSTRLEQELADERRQRQTVERDRDTHAARVVSETEQRYNAELNAVSTAYTSASEAVVSAKAAYRAALADGDHDKAADLQEAIAKAVGRREQAEAYKAQLEKNKDQILRPQQTRQDDEYGGLQLTSEERSWVSSRPQFRTDGSYRNRVVGASQIAAAEGHGRGSEGYFRRIEEIMGEGKRADQERREPDHDEPAPRRPSADVAPTRRAQPGAQPAGRVRVELSADEREVADAMYGNPTHDGYVADDAARYEKYFKHKQAMRASGRL